MNKRTKEEWGIIAVLTGILIFVMYVYFTPITLFDMGAYSGALPELAIPEMTNFQTFAILTIYAYDSLPTILQQFSIGAIGVQLLQTGFSPYLLGVVSVAGLLTGQMIMYSLGLVSKKVHRGSIGDMAKHNHYLHKYHFLIYLIVPFTGLLGDAVMIFTGHQRIKLWKVIPFLLIGDVIVVTKLLVPTLLQLEVGSALI